MKDQELTKKELTALCRKQEEYIKELEEKLKSPDTEKCCEPKRPDYDELVINNISLSDRNRELEEIVRALLYSLKKTNIERLVNEDESKHFKELLGKEHRRAEKLFEELENGTHNNR